MLRSYRMNTGTQHTKQRMLLSDRPNGTVTARIILFLILWATGNYAMAASVPIVLTDTDLSTLQGHVDFLPPDAVLDRGALLRGEYDQQFRRFDSKLVLNNTGGTWLRFRLTNTSNTNTIVITSSDTLYTNIELLYKNSDEKTEQQKAGLLYPYIKKSWGYHDIAFAVDQPTDTTRTYYLFLLVDFPLLLDGYVATPTAYALDQAEGTAVGHLLVGIMLGIMLYLAMISMYVRSLKEIHYCLGFVFSSFMVILFERGYLFSLIPHNSWLNIHLYSLVFTALIFTYVAFSRYHFKTINDFPLVDRLLRYSQNSAAFFMISGLIIPVAWSIAIIQILSLNIILLSIISVYIWSNSSRKMGSYVVGTLIFLFACILATTENLGLINLGGITRIGFELSLCFQSILFALALAEKINEYQYEQTLQAIKSAESQAETRTKNSFLAKMSHELRTPMNGMLGMLQLMENTPINNQQKHYMDVMRNSGRMLLSVIDDVLDYSRIISGKLRIETHDFNLHELIADIENIFIDTARQKNVQLHIKLANDSPVSVHGDAMRIRQILHNLIGNGLKFTATGSVTARVRVEKNTDQDWLLHGEVEDTGCGITDAQKTSLFHEFSQNNLTRDFGGSGLGLAICKQLVTLMGGTINVESAPGYGALFRFFIHIAPADHGDSKSAPSPHRLRDTATLTAATTKILVVEDNDINREVIGGLLSHLGFCAEFSTNGSDAVSQICQESAHWDMVLMDVEMPIMDGLQATQTIRLWESEQFRNAVPIVALTAHAGRGYEDVILKAGMDDYLGKPVDHKQLQNMLKKWLGTVADMKNYPAEN